MQMVLCRIDDRLIHGQLTTQWLPQYPADALFIVDDAVAADAFLSEMICMLAPAGLQVLVMDVPSAAQKMAELPPAARVILLVKTPLTLCALQKQGVDIPAVSVGGMGMRPGRSMLYKNIAASCEERSALQQLSESGCPVYCQILPSDKPVDIRSL